MSASFYEILELPSGEIILKRSDEDGTQDALVTIRFSAESIAYLGASRFEVAKAMIEAGMEAASDLAEINPEEPAVEPIVTQSHILH